MSSLPRSLVVWNIFLVIIFDWCTRNLYTNFAIRKTEIVESLYLFYLSGAFPVYDPGDVPSACVKHTEQVDSEFHASNKDTYQLICSNG